MVHHFCKGSLKFARLEAKRLSIKIPPISSSEMHTENYAVFLGDDWYSEHNSCCVWAARSEAIYDFIDTRDRNGN